SGAGCGLGAHMRVAVARGAQVALVKGAQPVLVAYRAVSRSECRQSGQQILQQWGRVAEEAAVGAAAWRSHCPSPAQKSPNTWVERIKPRTMFTATPAVNA